MAPADAGVTESSAITLDLANAHLYSPSIVVPQMCHDLKDYVGEFPYGPSDHGHASGHLRDDSAIG